MHHLFLIVMFCKNIPLKVLNRYGAVGSQTAVAKFKQQPRFRIILTLTRAVRLRRCKYTR